MAATPGGGGYWLDALDGGIFAFGNAPFYGSMGGKPLNAPVISMSNNTSTGGYWEVATDGGIFAYNAPFYGSMGGKYLSQPIVGMATTPGGGGYWLVAKDGGIFAYGNAGFYGSMGGRPLNAPIVSMTPTPNGGGYWLVAADGGIFAFGNAQFYGSLGGDALDRPIMAIASTPTGRGYWMTDTNGAVSAFGDAGYFGSAPQVISAPVVGMTIGMGNGDPTDTSYPSGAFGYDVSPYQENSSCTSALPGGHTVAVVQVTGEAGGAPNPCLSQEAAWAGAGLNLYMFLDYGTSSTVEPGCATPSGSSDAACDFGFQSALYSYQVAKNASGVNPNVTWWLDVEPGTWANGTPYWSSNTAENDELIQGAIEGLRSVGINNVGIYTSPLTWNETAGDFQPPVPLWIAWYTGDPQSNCANAVSFAASHGDMLPTGPVWLTQYTDVANGESLDGDYAC